MLSQERPQSESDPKTPDMADAEIAKVQIVQSLQAIESGTRTLRQALMHLWFPGPGGQL